MSTMPVVVREVVRCPIWSGCPSGPRSASKYRFWRADGHEIFYLSPLDPSVELGTHELRLMAVPVTTEPTFTFGQPRELFRGRFEIDRPPRSYDVTPDGRLFFFIQARERAPDVVTQISVIENWFVELERLAPVP